MNRVDKIERLIAPAMKTAVAFGLVPSYVDEDTYTRHWNAMEAVVDQARKPLEDELEEAWALLSSLRAQLAAAEAENKRLRAAIERYLDLESSCEYVEGEPAVCPDVVPCHWCQLRAALKEAGDG